MVRYNLQKLTFKVLSHRCIIPISPLQTIICLVHSSGTKVPSLLLVPRTESSGACLARCSVEKMFVHLWNECDWKAKVTIYVVKWYYWNSHFFIEMKSIGTLRTIIESLSNKVSLSTNGIVLKLYFRSLHKFIIARCILYFSFHIST